MKEEISFSVKMTAKEVYKFTLYHIYHSFSGFLGILLAAFSLIMLATSFQTLSNQTRTFLILLAAWVIVIDPLMLYSRAKSQVKKNKVYQKPLTYTLNADGITVSQEEISQTVAWERLRFIIETKSQYLIYSNRINAFIFPKEAVGDNCQALEEMAIAYTKDTDVILKGSMRRKQKLAFKNEV